MALKSASSRTKNKTQSRSVTAKRKSLSAIHSSISPQHSVNQPQAVLLSRLPQVDSPSRNDGMMVRLACEAETLRTVGLTFLRFHRRSTTDVIFKNQAMGSNDKSGQFVNDLLRTEFHKYVSFLSFFYLSSFFRGRPRGLSFFRSASAELHLPRSVLHLYYGI